MYCFDVNEEKVNGFVTDSASEVVVNVRARGAVSMSSILCVSEELRGVLE